MVYGSICSGIEAATVAWHPLGWRPAFFSEIEAFPRAVLSHHYPDVPLHGDFTTIGADDYEPINLLVGGTPCQDFSVAGLRAGMAGDRGNLTLQFLALAGRLRPRWLVWENVPGVLSSNGGRDFGAFLGGLGELGYGWAYRTLDAQYFGVPQRRRRVFVVGYLGDWRRAAAVLFERHSLQGHSAPRRKAGTPVAALTSTGVGTCGADDNQAQAWHLLAFSCKDDGGDFGESAPTLRAMGNKDSTPNAGGQLAVCVTGEIAHTLKADGFDASEDGTGRGQPIVTVEPMTFDWQASDGGSDTSFRGGSRAYITDPPGRTRALTSCKTLGLMQHSAVRRLTPVECERLQGFPDDYTLIPYRGKSSSDGPRYKALGNSMAVPCMAWIGQRIALVESLAAEAR